MEDRLKPLLPDSASVEKGQLRVATCDLSLLADEFGTPLYLYDESTLRNSARKAVAAFGAGNRVSFAAKACSIVGVLRVFAEEGLGLDVLSAGEIEAGLRAGIPPARMHLHGNYKTDEELRWAVRSGIHAVVLDNVEEVERLEIVCREERAAVPVMLRLDPPIRVETHPSVNTSGARSKFGFLANTDELNGVLRHLRGHPHLSLLGLHAHLGSQIADAAVYGRAASALIQLRSELRREGFSVEEINVGGGWAVPYRSGDGVLDACDVARVLPQGENVRWAVEPGRALVARAGVALYRVVAVKERDGRRLVIVDGGMGDNPRPALYGSRYMALLPTKVEAPPAGRASMVGRYCETGDVLVGDVSLPDVRAGELLAIPVSGAYQLSMASAYNGVPPPPAVLLRDGTARPLTRRATPAELLARDADPG